MRSLRSTATLDREYPAARHDIAAGHEISTAYREKFLPRITQEAAGTTLASTS
jgi:hypothetical protein